MYYLSRIAKAMAAVPETEEHTIVSQHSRFHELCELYGPPTITRKPLDPIDPSSIEARLIEFTFCFVPSVSDTAAVKSVTLIKKIPRTFGIYRLKGVVGKLFDQRPMSLKLIWETGELDPVPGYVEEWDSSDDEDDGSTRSGVDSGRKAATDAEELVKLGKWIRREVELVDSTRAVGFWIESKDARVRIELRR